MCEPGPQKPVPPPQQGRPRERRGQVAGGGHVAQARPVHSLPACLPGLCWRVSMGGSSFQRLKTGKFSVGARRTEHRLSAFETRGLAAGTPGPGPLLGWPLGMGPPPGPGSCFSRCLVFSYVLICPSGLSHSWPQTPPPQSLSISPLPPAWGRPSRLAFGVDQRPW